MEFKHIEYSRLDQTISHLAKKPQKLSFACAPLIFGILGPELLLSFQEAFPNIILDMLELPDADCDAYVLEDASHFGLLAIPENRHGDNPLAQLESVNFGMLKDENFLMMDKKSYCRKMIYSYTRKYGFKPIPSFESSDVNHLFRLVNTGNGIFLATDNPATKILFPNVVAVPFDDDTLTYSIAFVFQSYEKLDMAAKQFMEYILENVKT